MSESWSLHYASDVTDTHSTSAKVVYIKGRQHPVNIYHTAVSQPDYVDAALRTFFQIHTDQPPGDVLIFLPGLCLMPSPYDSLVDSVCRSRGYRQSREINQNVRRETTEGKPRCKTQNY